MRTRIIRYGLKGLAVLAGVVFLGACYLAGAPETGDLTFSLPTSDDFARMGLQPQVAEGDYDTARIYLSVQRAESVRLLDLTEGEETPPYLQVDDNEANSVTLSDIPVGSDYRLYAAFLSGDTLVAYAQSGLFDVSAGDNEAQTITLVESGFTTPAADLAAANITGLTASEGSIYLSTADSVVYAVSAAGDSEDISDAATTGTVNSVSGGGLSPAVYVNAENGIYGVSGSTLTVLEGYDATAYGAALTSIGFEADGTTAIAFQTATGLGFASDTATADTWEFFDTQEFVEGAAILDFAVDATDTEGKAFLATKVGGFAVSPADISDDDDEADSLDDLGEGVDVVQAIDVFSFYDGQINNNVAVGLAFDPQESNLYVATRGAGGAYSVDVITNAEGETVFSSGTQLAGVAKSVEDLAVQAGSDNPYVAFLSKFSVVLYRDGEGVVAEYPFVAYDTEPGQSTLITFRDTNGDDTDDELVIAGSNGLRVLTLP